MTEQEQKLEDVAKETVKESIQDHVELGKEALEEGNKEEVVRNLDAISFKAKRL